MSATEPGATGGSWRAAHRAALDHVLGLIAEAPWSESLVLRGSMAMLAWIGDQARAPHDLDFVVIPRSAVPVDLLDPYPYVDGIEVVQQWPEAADGAARYDFWRDPEEQFETRGARARVPPEGLRWVDSDDLVDAEPPYGDLIESVRRRPDAAPGVRLDAEKSRADGDWGYGDGDAGTAGVRLLIPWQAHDSLAGEVQLDFALDERLPQPPVWTRVPRGDGGRPTVIRTASRELSLQWKLHWLRADWLAEGKPQCKDLYDAVLLAESVGTVATTAPADFDLAAAHHWEADWTEFRRQHSRVRGTAEDWFHRLVSALALD
jgi:hypothetical protein